MNEIRFTLSVTGPDPEDLDELDDAARSLRSDLTEVSGIRVSNVLTNQDREGTRSGIVTEVISGGGVGLAIVYYGSTMVRGISQDIVKAIQNWQGRNKGKRITLKAMDGSSIELQDYSEEESVHFLERLNEKQQSKVIDNE